MCGGWRNTDYSRLRDPDRKKIVGLIFFLFFFSFFLFLNRGIFSLRVSVVDRKVRDGVLICKRSARYWGVEAVNSEQHGRYSLPGVLLVVLTAGIDERCRSGWREHHRCRNNGRSLHQMLLPGK